MKTSTILQTFSNGKYQINWRGVERMKDAADIIIYEHMIWNLKPKSIIEIGTAQGGRFNMYCCLDLAVFTVLDLDLRCSI